MTVKRARFGMLVPLCMFMLVETASAKNFIYKGSQQARNPVTGVKLKLSLYLVLGEGSPVSNAADYFEMPARALIVGGLAGKKRFLRYPINPFRTVISTVDVGGKPRIGAVVASGGGVGTDEGGVGHQFFGDVLTGIVTEPLYRMPLKLAGVRVDSIGQGVVDAVGSATITTSKYKLVRDLTDPIPPGETVDQSLDRVVTFLMERGFIELVP